jgi:hypothetical protein
MPAGGGQDAGGPCRMLLSVIETVFGDGCHCWLVWQCRVASVRKKAMWGAPRLISTGAQKGSHSTPSGRPRPDEQGFRESTTFYTTVGRLRACRKKS